MTEEMSNKDMKGALKSGLVSSRNSEEPSGS